MGYRVNECCNTDGIPMYIISEFLKEIQINTLVELGTAGGASAKEAAKHFKEVITIELNENRPEYDVSLVNIKWLIGNTIDILPGLVNGFIKYKEDYKSEDDHEYVLFFVDSHFDGDKPAGSKNKDCYLLEELEIISRYSQDAIVIIDDARLFMGNPPQPNDASQWPSIQSIFKLFSEKYPYHFTTIIDDYIISISDRDKWIFDLIWMKTYDKRYPSDKERIRNSVKLAYESFVNYIQ